MSRQTKEGASVSRRSSGTRPIHVGRPPSRCGRASTRSAWVPEDGAEGATCQLCTGTWRPPAPHVRCEALDASARVLVAWRLRRGLTQEQAAELMGTSRPRYTSLERLGDGMKVADLARIIGATPGDVVRFILETSGGDR